MKQLVTVMVIALALSLNACRGPEGPAGAQGPAGSNGKDGKDAGFVYFDGFKADLKCASCHNPEVDTANFVWPKKYQWELSKHFYGGDFERSQTPCAGCHTTEGFIERSKASFPGQDNWSGVVTSHTEASPPGCFACHSPHSNGDFQLRNKNAVTVLSPMKDITNPSLDMGKGNLCISCHQPRSLSPQMPKGGVAPGTTDELKITSSRWYPHYGVQGLMMKGAGFGGGYEFPGKTYSNSFHGTSAFSSGSTLNKEGCVTCHMAPANPGSGISGGHTMNIHYTGPHGEDGWNVAGCTQSGCHSAMTSVDNYVSSSSSLTGGVGAHKYVHMYLDTLKQLLIDKKLVNAADGLVLGGDGVKTASSSNPKIFTGSQILKAGAMYNYYFIEHDLSGGVHNSMYAIQLLKDSIEEMKKP